MNNMGLRAPTVTFRPAPRTGPHVFLLLFCFQECDIHSSSYMPLFKNHIFSDGELFHSPFIVKRPLSIFKLVPPLEAAKKRWGERLSAFSTEAGSKSFEMSCMLKKK